MSILYNLNSDYITYEFEEYNLHSDGEIHPASSDDERSLETSGSSESEYISYLVDEEGNLQLENIIQQTGEVLEQEEISQQTGEEIIQETREVLEQEEIIQETGEVLEQEEIIQEIGEEIIQQTGEVLEQEERRGNGYYIFIPVVMSGLAGIMGGIMLGYVNAISGGINSSAYFYKSLFPSIYSRDQTGYNEGVYCRYKDRKLMLFTSSLDVASFVGALFTPPITKMFGRKSSIFIAALIVLVGAFISGVVTTIALLFIGRLTLGLRVGLAKQCIPVYLSEMAPPKIRGYLGLMLPLGYAIGNLIGSVINYSATDMTDRMSWAIFLGVAALLPFLLLIAAFFILESPSSLIERGYLEDGHRVLQKIRGRVDVTKEFQYLVHANEDAERSGRTWRSIFLPKYRPGLIISILIPIFQQLSGIGAVILYASIIFEALGFGADASQLASVIQGSLNTLATFWAIILVEKWGRRPLLLLGGIHMIIVMIIVGILMALMFGTAGTYHISHVNGSVTFGLICLFVMPYYWSWDALGGLVIAEVCPLEVRLAAQAVNVAVSMVFNVIITQLFLTMLCHLKYGIFFFFAGMVMLMTVFVCFFVPETKEIPTEEMKQIWELHWFWRKYVRNRAPSQYDTIAV